MKKIILAILIAFSASFIYAQAPAVLPTDVMEGTRSDGAIGHRMDSVAAFVQRNISVATPTLQQVTTAGATTSTQVTFSATYIEGVDAAVTGTTKTIDGTKLRIPFTLGASNCTATITAGLQIGVPYKLDFVSTSGGNIILKTSTGETVNGQASTGSYTIYAARAGQTFNLVKVSSTAYIVSN